MIKRAYTDLKMNTYFREQLMQYDLETLAVKK